MEADVYMAAVTRSYEDGKGNLYVTNGEYESRVNFCPFCGHAAKSQMKGNS